MLRRILLPIFAVTLPLSMLFPYGNVGAAVPVEVVEFGAGTQFEESIEVFMFDLFSTLQKREEDFTTSFELQKIEKAREDVAKLVYETQRELVDNGIIMNVNDPITGATYTIKKPGRIIHNLDDFLYEEPIQKGRDFLYCYFGGDLSPGITPWKIFPFADTESESIALQRKLRDEMLTLIQRKIKYRQTSPPQTWYTQELCSRVLSSFPVTSECFDKPESPECPSKATQNYQPTLSKSLGGIRQERGYFTINELSEAVLNPNNTYQGVKDYAGSVVKTIIGQYAGLRYAEYIAGQGVAPERVYAQYIEPVTGKWYWFDTDYIVSPAVILLQKMQAATQAQFDLAQNAFMNLHPIYESIIVPDGSGEDILEKYNLTVSAPSQRTITNAAGKTFMLPEWIKTISLEPQFKSNIFPDPELAYLSGLPAPWEDNYDYAKLRGSDPSDAYNPTDYILPSPSEPDIDLEEPYIGYTTDGFANIARRPEYRWFRDVLELYDYGSDIPVQGNPHEGWQKLLEKWFYPLGAF